MDEKEIFMDYIRKKNIVDNLEHNLSSAKDELNFVKEKLIQYLQDRGQNRTGSYEGFGSITLKSFNTYKVNEENQPLLMDFLSENQLDGVIKQSVHHKTLDRVLNELIEEGKPLPEFINTYNVTTVQLNKG